jgi:nucleoside-diphosphate-sugar epimerase
VNGINKISGEFYHLVYNQVYKIRACSLRLTNTYGPRQLIRHNRQGFIGWFMRKAVLGETIEVFGDGAQRRDFDYVDDVVDAFLRAGASEASNGQVLNLGGGPPISLLDLAKDLVKLSGRSEIKVVPFPEERKKIDIGDFYSDARKIESLLGWKSTTTFAEGLARTIDYYLQHKDRYL